jgi:RHS repeat-associated protein
VVTAGPAGYVNVAFAYTGKLFETDNGLQYNWHRWYDPAVGRWLSEDWIRDDASNTYCYVGNTSTTYVDYNGLEGVFRDIAQGVNSKLPWGAYPAALRSSPPPRWASCGFPLSWRFGRACGRHAVFQFGTQPSGAP